MFPCWYCKWGGLLRPTQVYSVFDWGHWRAIGAYAGVIALQRLYDQLA
jgi:hypothetical protein